MRSAWAATQRGDFQTALRDYNQAKSLADRCLDQQQIDSAALNVAMVYIQMGEPKKGEEGLREILLRTLDDKLAFTAAYNLASSLRKQGRNERALAYARRAYERARKMSTPDHLSQAHNLLGNIFLSQSYLDDALSEYETALSIRDAQNADTRYSRAILLENLGYCLLLKQRLDEGLLKIQQALSLAKEVDDHRCRVECLQDLCYGLLLKGEYEEAIARGETALVEAQEADYKDIAENCHYLLGELGTRTDNLEARDHHFRCLQALHPELPFLKDFLCAVDVTRIITLKR